jgi:MOSC domain-containing protein
MVAGLAVACEGVVMHVVSLHTYPVKGCHRVDHDEITVQPWGVVGDRRWLIVDEKGGAVTQREVPALTGLRADLTPDGELRLSLPDRDDLTIAEPVVGPLVPISVFAWRGQATLADLAAHEWLTAGLGVPVRLVWQDDPGRRAPDSPNVRPGDRMMFQDDFPVSLANLASLAALNNLIAESGSVEGPLPITRFRPNIVLDGAQPWAEDGWTGRRLRVGEATFHVPEGSGRCLVTTTDQETGERGHEPLRTLGRHRNFDQRLLFATLLVPDGPAPVRVGDRLIPL